MPKGPLGHQWILVTEEAVDVIVDPVSGKPYAVRSSSESVGEATGCSACGMPLTVVSVSMLCEPLMEEEDDNESSVGTCGS